MRPGAPGVFFSGWLALVALPALGAPRGGEQELDAKALLDRVDDLYRGKSSHGEVVMQVVTENWTRTLELETWSEGEDKSLIRILAPAKEKGTATLKVHDDIWNYLPKVKRVIKVPSSMMGGSWMGSHFTNDDLVRSSRMSEDYTCELTEQQGAGVITILCTAKPDAPVVWGKVEVKLERSSRLPRSIRYYDEKGKLSRTLTFSAPKKLDGRLVPTVTTMEPSDAPGEKTEIRYREMDFDVDLPGDLFSLRSLQR